MILSDGTLMHIGPEVFRPYDPALVQPASYEVRLARGLKHADGTESDMRIEPGGFRLASTIETINVPAYLVAQVNGKSSWGRRGLLVHVTAGFIDPGFHGQITLEMVNLSSQVIQLQAGYKIAQVVFTRLDQPAVKPYGSDGLGSHYQHQRGATIAEGAI